MLDPYRSIATFFLNDIGHDYTACQCMREHFCTKSSTYKEQRYSVCMACEMDRILLNTFGSAIGINVIEALEEIPIHTPKKEKDSFHRHFGKGDIYVSSSSSSSSQEPMTVTKRLETIDQQPSITNIDNIDSSAGISKGSPIIPIHFFAASWNSAGMIHLAGYEQRDAHEFLHAFLDTMGKDTQMYHELAIKLGGCNSKNLKINPSSFFEGTFTSSLICECCGAKRSQPEPFLIVSLPITKRKHKLSTLLASQTINNNASNGPRTAVSRRGLANLLKTNIQDCLIQFTEPEALTDQVRCSSCGKKTPTQKQHTFAKLPKVLCLHLKRFDANTNKKSQIL